MHVTFTVFIASPDNMKRTFIFNAADIGLPRLAHGAD